MAKKTDIIKSTARKVVRQIGRAKERLSVDGKEIPNPLPMAPPVGFVKRPSLTEQIREMVRSEALRQAAEAQGKETFADADDFAVDDEQDPHSDYEEVFEPDVEEDYTDPGLQKLIDLLDKRLPPVQASTEGEEA